MVQWLKNKIELNEIAISKQRDKLASLNQNWNSFLSKDTYLICGEKNNFLFRTKAIKSQSKVKWFLFWNLSLNSLVNSLRLDLDIFNEGVLNYNSKFIKKRLKEYSTFLAGDDDKLDHPLDSDQRTAVIKDDKHSLVIAGAGSGKTKVLISKIAYLVRRKDSIKPEKILALAFTNVAAKEMQNRLKKEYGIDINISTFHKFGNNIISEVTKQHPKLLFNGDNADYKFKEVINNLINSSLADKEFQKLFVDYISDHLYEDPANIKFKEKELYYEYMRSKKYATLTNVKVKSLAERDIANFLFKHNIKFEYEPKVTWSDSNPKFKEYEPDFFIPDLNIYVEHWGLNEKYEVPEWFSMSSEEYNLKKDWVCNQFDKHSKTLIQTYEFERQQNSLLKKLKIRLLKHNNKILFNTLTYKELVEKTYEFKETKQKLSGLIHTFIQLAKSNLLTPEKVTNRINSTNYDVRQKSFAKIANEIYSKYENLLQKENRIDFNDMINKAADLVNSNKSLFLNKYDYILVDEFQDISKQRLELIKCFVNPESKTKLFCVGDDWQSIYHFAGSEVDFFVNFKEYFEYPDLIYLSKNYRCSKTIVDMSNDLIKNNSNQIKKTVISHNKLVRKAELFELNENFSCLIERQTGHILKKIKTLIAKGVKPEEILIISRFNKNLKKMKQVFSKKGLPTNKERQKGIRFYSAHKSKGTQAKHVFLIDVISGTYGFPCEIENDSVLAIAKNPRNQESFEEERRLFYVALTRSKEFLYIYTNKNSKSLFLTEIAEYLEPPKPINFFDFT